MTKYEKFLNRYSETEWHTALDKIESEIHPVDRNATRIWFRFYPLALHQTLEQAANREELARKFILQGRYRLAGQIDSSHRFLYGHRFWPAVKEAIETRTGTYQDDATDLVAEIRRIAAAAAAKISEKDVSLILGITAVGLMTLVQTGLEAFQQAAGRIEDPQGLLGRDPKKIVAARREDDSQGLLGFLRTVDQRFTVNYDETRSDGTFKVYNDEEIASASARDQSRNWREIDERCIEGVIPVECRSASCGTCWVGIVSGAEKLSAVTRLERKQMKVFGYGQGEDDKPLMRLSCQARAYGNIHLVIPPWNGVFGKKVYGNVERVELEPATTSAAKLRKQLSNTADNTK